MDKDRVEGAEKGIICKVKEVAGKVLGYAKLETEGKTAEAAGKIQNAVGGVKDTLKETTAEEGQRLHSVDRLPAGRDILDETGIRAARVII
jgi:uncharacterized protein YjbJ (UPF0337 family)